jgi:alpha-amylase
LITQAHRKYAGVYANMVNHNSRPIEKIIIYGTQTYTNFTGVASGKFPELAQIFYKMAMPVMMKELWRFQI